MNLPATAAPQPNSAAWVPLFCLLAVGTLMGLSTNLAKLAGEAHLPPLAFLCWSIVGAALVLLAAAAVRHRLPPVDGRALEYYLVSALVGVAGPNLIIVSAVPHVGAGFVALTIALPPLLTYLGALALGMERFQWTRASGVVAALAGAGILAAHQLARPHADEYWVLLVLAGPVLLAIGNLYRTLRWPEGVSADALAPGMLVAAAVVLLAAGQLPGWSLAVPLAGGLPPVLIVVQALVFAAVFLLLFILQKTGGPVMLSLLGSVAAVVGVLIAILLQGEAPPGGLLPGAALTAAGVALLSLGKARPA